MCIHTHTHTHTLIAKGFKQSSFQQNRSDMMSSQDLLLQSSREHGCPESSWRSCWRVYTV